LNTLRAVWYKKGGVPAREGCQEPWGFPRQRFGGVSGGFPSGSFSLDKPKAAWYKESGHPARGALQELKVFLQQHFQRVPRVFLRALSFLRELWISPGRRGIREAAFP
jgi:hypothetical protein